MVRMITPSIRRMKRWYGDCNDPIYHHYHQAFEEDSKRSHVVVVGDDETTVSPARKAPKTSATVTVPRPDQVSRLGKCLMLLITYRQAKEGLTESPSTMLDSANNNATIS